MNLKTRLILLAITIFIAFVVRKYRDVTKSLPRPNVDEDYYWGQGLKADKEDRAIKPFQVDFSADQIKKLRTKLEDYDHLHPQLEGISYEYGMNTKKLKEIIKYWKDEYLNKWDERQAIFNRFPQYKTEIQGLNIHYIHAKPVGDTKGKIIYPLLVIHGWPGSVREFNEFIPKLTQVRDDQDFVFEVIAPSLPGFGWSDAAKKPGMGSSDMAIVLRNLMNRLGFGRYFIQGGDWGSIVGSNIATLYPNDVIGYHSNMCFITTPLAAIKYIVASWYPSRFVPKKYESMFFPLGEKFKGILSRTGYFHIAATKPDTIGAAIEGNPIGLASYILEKFASYFKTISVDDLLDNLMVYYMTNSFTTANRIYYEQYHGNEPNYQIGRVQTSVPTGCVRFPVDLFYSLDWQLKNKYTNLIHSTYADIGGHFAALEVPDILYNDFIEFVQKTLEQSVVVY